MLRLSLLLALALTLSLSLTAREAAKWSVDTLDNDAGWVLRSDEEPQVETRQVPIFPMIAENNRIRKTFDLSALPEGALEQVKAVSVRFFCMIADQSVAVRKLPELNGLAEEWSLTANGRKQVFGTADARLPRVRKWTDFVLPSEVLKDGKIVIEIQKLASKTNDDFLYIGLDNRIASISTEYTTNSGVKYTSDGGEAMVRLVLWKDLNELSCDFAANGEGQVTLENGANINDKHLHLNGLKSQAILKDSSSFNVTPAGLTMTAVICPRNNPEDSSKLDNNMMVACKPGAWFLGRTGNTYNMSFCTEGIRWNNALIEGEFPELDSWMHLALVFEHVNETAQGNVGYNVMIYCNGALQAKRFFHGLQPDASDNEIILGQGDWEGYGFQGDMASVAFCKRALSEDEVAKLAAACPVISHLPPGFYELTEQIDATLRKLQAAAPAPEGRWLAAALRRSFETGFDKTRQDQLLDIVAEVIASSQEPAALADAFNQAQNDFQLAESDGNLLLIVKGEASLTSPVAGFYSAMTKGEILSGRGLGWSLRLGGSLVHDYGSNIKFAVSPLRRSDDGASEFTVVWERSSAFRCLSDFRFLGSRLEQTMEVENLDSNRLLRQVIFPHLTVAKLPGASDELVFPMFSGIIRKNPTKGVSCSGGYPTARATMQFAGYYDCDDNGIYLALEATDGAYKFCSVTGRTGYLRYDWENQVGHKAGATGGNGFKLAGKAVLEAYRGDWFDAGQIYKKFLAKECDWYVKDENLPRQDTPQWYRDNLLWMASSAEEPESLLYLRKFYEVPYAIWWCWWENVPKQMQPPIIEPTEASSKWTKLLTKAGIRIHPYINARLWGFSERPSGAYDRTNEEGALKYAVLQENGSIFKESYGHPYAVMCPGCEEWRNVLLKDVDVVADMGSNGVYFDQLPCGSPQPCFNADHGHDLADPTVWARGYRQMLRDLRAKYPHLGLDGEDNAEVYAADLDGFMTWRWTENNHIQLFQSVYGGGRAQFTARAYDAFGYGPGSYEASFAKAGEQLVNSEQIGWMHANDSRLAIPRRMFLKKMAHLRKALLSYFNAGDMLHPLKFREPQPTLTCVWGNCPGPKQTTPAIQHGVWRRLKDGRAMVVFVNTTDKVQTSKPILNFPEYASLAVCREGNPLVEYIDLTPDAVIPEVTLAPYASQVWLLGPAPDVQECEDMADALLKISAIKDSGDNIHRTPEKFDNCAKWTAEPGKWYRAKDASWMVFAYRENTNTLGHRDKSPDPAEDGNWILGKKGGIVYFGEVDFGETAPSALELEIAVGKEQAGGKIAVYDISGDSRPDRCLAETTTDFTGGWFTFQTVKLPCLVPVTGKRRIAIRFEDNDCNFRAWRIAE